MEAVTRTKGKEASKYKKTRKGTRLDLLFGCFKGQIFYDNAIFNLGVKQNGEAILH